jgi:hypothetical protein
MKKLVSDSGSATAEYAIATMVAVSQFIHGFDRRWWIDSVSVRKGKLEK